jgi:hypothetical protein
MRSVMKAFVVVLVSFLTFSVLLVPGHTQATPYGTFDVFAPTGLSTLPVGYSSGPNNAMKLDSWYVTLTSGSPGTSGVSVQNFTSTTYSNFWVPYSNRSAFPLVNATILSVSMIAIAYVPAETSIQMFAMHDVDGTYYSFHNGPEVSGSYWTFQEFEVDLTADYAWNASMLIDTTFLRIVLMAYGSGTPVYVDYVGLSYTWQYGPAPPPSGGPIAWDSSWITNIFITTLAGVGFIGVIAYPGLAIYSYKSKDEKLGAFVSFIIGETLFTGMLWFALSVITGNI